MRLLMINNEYPPLGGGQANANFHIYRELQKNHPDLEIDLITASTDTYREEQQKQGTIFFLDIGKKGENLHHQGALTLLRFAWRSQSFAKGLMRKKNYDLLMAWSGIPAGFTAWRLRRRCPYAVLLRGSDVPFHEGKWRMLDRMVLQYLSPRIWRKARFVTTPSAYLAKLAGKVSSKTKAVVIPNGIDTGFFNPEGRTKAFPTGKKVILAVGRLAAIKGYDRLIEAVAKLPADTYELRIAGRGSEEEQLRALAGKSGIDVKFLGLLDRDSLHRAYMDADLFCQNSENEGMSNALLEAMACACPVITTPVGGTRELIDGNGSFVSGTDIGEIASAIESIFRDKSAYERMSARSLEISRDFSWEKAAAAYYTLLKEHISTGNQ